VIKLLFNYPYVYLKACSVDRGVDRRCAMCIVHTVWRQPLRVVYVDLQQLTPGVGDSILDSQFFKVKI